MNKTGKTSVLQELTGQSEPSIKAYGNIHVHLVYDEWLFTKRDIEYRFIEAAGLAEAVKSPSDEERKVGCLRRLMTSAHKLIDLIV